MSGSVPRNRCVSLEKHPPSPTKRRSQSPPTMTFHPRITIPTPALVDSVAAGAHYSGTRLDHDPDSSEKRRRNSDSRDARDVHTELKPSHKQVLDDLRDLYSCRPSLEIFERSWNKNAEFEDPLSKCRGFGQYAAQWYALPKLFSQSKTISRRVMSSTHEPNRLVFSQSQSYTFRLFRKEKTIDSVIVVELDEDEKIIRMVDQWDGKALPSRYGALYFRLLNAKIMPWLVSVR